MAQFYASIQGTRGQATRTGDRSSGIQGHVRGWHVGVAVYGRVSDGEDVFDVYATSGSAGYGSNRYIGTVKLNGEGTPEFTPSSLIANA